MSSIKTFFHDNIKVNKNKLTWIKIYFRIHNIFFNKLTAYGGHTIDVLKWKVGSKKRRGKPNSQNVKTIYNIEDLVYS